MGGAADRHNEGAHKGNAAFQISGLGVQWEESLALGGGLDLVASVPAPEHAFRSLVVTSSTSIHMFTVCLFNTYCVPGTCSSGN